MFLYIERMLGMPHPLCGIPKFLLTNWNITLLPTWWQYLLHSFHSLESFNLVAYWINIQNVLVLLLNLLNFNHLMTFNYTQFYNGNDGLFFLLFVKGNFMRYRLNCCEIHKYFTNGLPHGHVQKKKSHWAPLVPIAFPYVPNTFPPGFTCIPHAHCSSPT